MAKDAASGIKAENENPVVNYYIYLGGKKMKTGKVNVIDKKLDASGAYTEVVGNITISKDKAYDSNNLKIDVDTIDVAGNRSVSSADTTVTAKYDFTAPTAKLELQQELMVISGLPMVLHSLLLRRTILQELKK